MAATKDKVPATRGEVLPAEDLTTFEHLAVLREHGVITNVGFDFEKLPADMSVERWVALGRMLGETSGSLYFLIGDWINWGVEAFGVDVATQEGVEDTTKDRYDEMQRVTGFPRSRLTNIASICQRVALARRRPEIKDGSFWIHGEIAALEPDAQAQWLARVVDEGLTRAELRRLMNGEELVAPLPGAGSGGDGGRRTICEQIETSARLVWNAGQVVKREGFAKVPLEQWAQLGAALGEE